MAVQFDGNNKLIIVDNGITDLTMQGVYSDWKEWMLISDNAKYEHAFSVLGGDPLPGSRYLGSTFFLENDWRIRPYEGDHTLTVDGNLYDRLGASPYVSTIGAYNVFIISTVSDLVQTIDTSGGATISNTDVQNIAANAASQVWDKDKGEVNTANTMGEHVKEKILTQNKFLALKD